MDESVPLLELLRRDGVVRGADARMTPMAGGVSCEIYLVEDGGEQFVVKRALAKLKVKQDWFADVNRSRHEWEYIRYVARFLPSAVPRLRHCSTAGNYFAMELLNGTFENWKQLLLAGRADVAHARSAGNLLARIHRQSFGDVEAKQMFDTASNFFQLRLDPYLLATGARHRELQRLFEAEVERLAATRECLVHGDFSPKNILISPERMVLLDCEVAWYGDPAFDLAFLLNHFFLKALLRPANATALRQMTEEFWAAYQSVRPAPELDARVGRLLPMLMLARVDGKSPVEYLDTARQQIVREFTKAILSRAECSFHQLADLWFNRMRPFEK